MPPTATLSTIPSDIVYEICENLSNQDFLNLQLVSPSLSSKLPRSRLDKIHSQRAIRFTDIETRKLERLISTRPAERLERIKHLVFNITSPHITLIPNHRFSHGINSYSWSTKVKILKFYHNYLERNPGSERNLKREATDVPRFLPGSETPVDKQWPRPEHFLAFFSILASAVPPIPTFDQKAFFRALTEVLKLLPNLQTLEFIETRSHPRQRHQVSLLFEEYNHSLKAFVSNNPDLEELPWMEWLLVKGNLIRFDTAYLTVLFCTAIAGCRRITEIKTDRMQFISDYSTGVSFSQFSTYNTGTVSIPTSLQTLQLYENAYLDQYQQAFKTLRRLEMWCLGIELNTTEEVSPLFLATIKNVQELSFSRPLDYSKVYSIVLPNTLLPNLRRLEIISGRVDLNSLLELVRTNENSLRELTLQGACNDNMSKASIIEFLELMRRTINLESCEIDFVTYREEIQRACFLLVDVKGGWRDDSGGCRYRVSSRCVRLELDPVFEPWEGADWEEQQTWEGFIMGIEGVGAPQNCLDHWGGRPRRYLDNLELA
ncbi:hypothetical protein TWF506_010496 [Arthrobotrys conoides]|uniref:F-box domain-containing protein n=1 Tax=Arthrobotrys conoides TaxID=74498 RepID=A0AAN8N6K8_9PEZI